MEEIKKLEKYKGKISYYSENDSNFIAENQFGNIPNKNNIIEKEKNYESNKNAERINKNNLNNQISLEEEKNNEIRNMNETNVLNKKNNTTPDKSKNRPPKEVLVQLEKDNNEHGKYEENKSEIIEVKDDFIDENLKKKNYSNRKTPNKTSFNNVSKNGYSDLNNNDDFTRNTPLPNNFNNISNVNNINYNTNSTFNMNYYNNKFENLAQKSMSHNINSLQKKREFNLTLGEVSRIFKIFKIISDGERQIEIIRQVLSEISRFDPFATFKYFDFENKNFLTKNNFLHYLK